MEEASIFDIYIAIKIHIDLILYNKPDEVNALVFDMGTTSTRAGYAGEDTPRVMFPTSYGVVEHEEDVVMTEQGEDEEPQKTEKKKTREYYIGDIGVNKWRANMEIKNPLKDGLGNILSIY
jgi:actin-related protein